jgi:hypothetical protein
MSKRDGVDLFSLTVFLDEKPTLTMSRQESPAPCTAIHMGPLTLICYDADVAGLRKLAEVVAAALANVPNSAATGEAEPCLHCGAPEEEQAKVKDDGMSEDACPECGVRPRPAGVGVVLGPEPADIVDDLEF